MSCRYRARFGVRPQHLTPPAVVSAQGRIYSAAIAALLGGMGRGRDRGNFEKERDDGTDEPGDPERPIDTRRLAL